MTERSPERQKEEETVKKEKKLLLLKECLNTKKLARVYFSYAPYYYYFYPNDVSNKFLLAQEENDFQLDGYHVRKISHMSRVQIKDDLCSEINIWNGVADQVRSPGIDISSWHSIFSDLQKLKGFIIIEDEINGQFAIGKIIKVCKHHLKFRHFDAEGIWEEEPQTIPYSSITHVAWNTRYTDNWEGFLASKAQ